MLRAIFSTQHQRMTDRWTSDRNSISIALPACWRAIKTTRRMLQRKLTTWTPRIIAQYLLSRDSASSICYEKAIFCRLNGVCDWFCGWTVENHISVSDIFDVFTLKVRHDTYSYCVLCWFNGPIKVLRHIMMVLKRQNKTMSDKTWRTGLRRTA